MSFILLFSKWLADIIVQGDAEQGENAYGYGSR